MVFPFQFRLSSPLVKGGIVAVDILVIGTLLNAAQAIGKALVVDDLALTQKLDGIAHVGVIRQTQNVVVGHARLLLRGIDDRTTSL